MKIRSVIRCSLAQALRYALGGVLAFQTGCATEVGGMDEEVDASVDGLNGNFVDIVWRANDGQVALWTIDEGRIVDTTYPGGKDPGLTWTIQGTGDFDGYGESDILWRHRDGQVVIWKMQYGQIVREERPGGPVGPEWTIVGVGDFDNDRQSDILWRASNGQLAIWFSGYPTRQAYPTYQNQGAPTDLAWKVAGVGDFDADGRSDILWRHTGGQVAIWYMNGGLMTGASYPAANPGAYWEINAVAVLDRNQRADIVWRGIHGEVAVWLDGSDQKAVYPSYQNGGGPVDLSWKIAAAGRLGTSKRGLLWRNDTGQVSMWFLDGGTFVGEAYPGAPGNEWQIKGLLQFDPRLDLPPGAPR